MRETAWAQLIRALVAAGREAEAIETYHEFRALVRERLGMDPSAALQELYLSVLTDSEARVPAAPAGVIEHRPRELPAPPGRFVGRAAELAALDELVRPTRAGTAVAVIDGGPGIGKTALATHWCNRVAGLYPDGQLYLNLGGFGPTPRLDVDAALHALLRALGLPAAEVPTDTAAASALFRTSTRGKRILVLLDNATSTDQVRALLPGYGCLTVVTSRNQLRGLVVRDDAVRASLSRLSPVESTDLLTGILGGGRTGPEPAAVARLAQLCDHTPLALRILAERIARHPDGGLAEFVEDLLRRGDDWLDSLDAGDDDLTNLRAVLSWSYASLDSHIARTFRLVGGLHPGGEVSLAAATALLGVSPAVARLRLDRLVSANLLEQHRRDRYTTHDLVRAFAIEQARREEDRAAVRRVLDWYLHTADSAVRALEPQAPRTPLEPVTGGVTPLSFTDRHDALHWLETEYRTLIALPAWAFAEGADWHACHLAHRLEYHARHHDLLATHRVALDAAVRAQDVGMRGHLLSAMGIANADLNRRAEADRCHRQALDAFRLAGDGPGEAEVLGNMASLYAEWGDYASARPPCEASLELSTRLGRERGRAVNLDTLGEIHFGSGEYVPAIACWRRALEINRRAGSRWAEVIDVTNLGRGYAALGRYPRAVRYYRQAMALAAELGSAESRADVSAARRSWQEALTILEELADEHRHRDMASSATGA